MAKIFFSDIQSGTLNYLTPRLKEKLEQKDKKTIHITQDSEGFQICLFCVVLNFFVLLKVDNLMGRVLLRMVVQDKSKEKETPRIFGGLIDQAERLARDFIVKV